MLEQSPKGFLVLTPTDSIDAIVPIFCFDGQCKFCCAFNIHHNGYLVSRTVNTRVLESWITKTLASGKKPLSPFWKLDRSPVIAQPNGHVDQHFKGLPRQIGVP